MRGKVLERQMSPVMSWCIHEVEIIIDNESISTSDQPNKVYLGLVGCQRYDSYRDNKKVQYLLYTMTTMTA